jgi:preprotein translocase subunit SecG
MLSMLTLGANITVTILATLFVLTCLFMMLIILIQKPKGGGLSGAFGGAGGSAQAAFGAKTGDLLTTITIGCFVAFLGLAIGLVYAIRDDVTPKDPSVIPAVSTPEIPAEATTDPDQTPSETDAAVEEAPAAPAEVPADVPVDVSTDVPATDTQP